MTTIAEELEELKILKDKNKYLENRIAQLQLELRHTARQADTLRSELHIKMQHLDNACRLLKTARPPRGVPGTDVLCGKKLSWSGERDQLLKRVADKDHVWRSMDTAPKDGRWIVIKPTDYDPVVVCWSQGRHWYDGESVVGFSHIDGWAPLPF